LIEFENLTSYDFDIHLLEKIAKSVTKKDIEFVLCDDLHIRLLNKEFRGCDCATDVLSFPLESIPHAPLGTVIISLDRAKDEAKLYNHSVDEEIALLFIHGLLHLLGYDHEVDEGQMRQKEKELIEKFQLPKSLIVRNS